MSYKLAPLHHLCVKSILVMKSSSSGHQSGYDSWRLKRLFREEFCTPHLTHTYRCTNVTKFFSPGLFFTLFQIFVHIMVVCWLGFSGWGLGVGFWGWGCSVDGVWCLWYVAFLFFGVQALHINRRTTLGKNLAY